MIDFEALITKQAGEDGSIPAGNVSKLATSISSAVGREFVAKDRYNARLEEIETLKGEKQTAEDNATNAGKWEAKYNKLKDEFDTFKADADAKALESQKRDILRQIAKDAGLSAAGVEKAVKYTDPKKVEMDKDGKATNADALKSEIQTEWADFKVSTRTDGAKVDTPPKAPETGANPRAAEIARSRYERLYGKAPAKPEPTNNNND